MVLSVSTAWTLAMTRQDVEVAWLVDLELGPAGFVTVVDYSAATGAAARITLSNGVIVELVEGVDWSLGASNAEAGASIAAAINAHVTLPSFVLAASKNGLVHIISVDETLTSIVVSTDTPAALSITPEALASTSSFAMSTRPIGNRLLSVAGVSPFSSSMDIITRKVRTGDIEIHFLDDGALRDVFRRTHPKGKRVTIQIGSASLWEASLDESDFAPFGTYVIDDWLPEPGGIAVRCIEPYGFALDTEITGEYYNVHPLAAIREILRQVGVPDGFVNSDSLESTDPRYEDISHWSCGRHNRLVADSEVVTKNGVMEPTSAKVLIDDLSQLVSGSLQSSEDGALSFVRYNPDAAVVRNLDMSEDDVADFEPVSSCDNVTNKVAVSGVVDSSPGAATDRTPLFATKSVFAQASMSVSGTNRDFSTSISSDWIGVSAYLKNSLASSDMTVDVALCQPANMTGTRLNVSADLYSPVTQRTEDTLSADRTAFLMITDGTASEIIEVDGFSHPGAPYPGAIAADPAIDYLVLGVGASGLFVEPSMTPSGPTPDAQTYEFRRTGRFTIVARGAKGTSARDWTIYTGRTRNNIRVFDITLAVSLAESRLARFAFGCPIWKLRASMRHWDLQLGDLVTVTSDLFLDFGKDGADSNTVWEIISKETQIGDDSPAVVFTLAWTRDNVTPTPVPVGVPIVPTVVVLPSLDDGLVDDNGNPISNDVGTRVLSG